MKKEIDCQPSWYNFCVGIKIQGNIHGSMAIGKHSKLEKNDCCTNNVSLIKK